MRSTSRRPTPSGPTSACRSCTTAREGPKPGVNTAHDCKAKRGKWHIYTLLWGPERIEIKVDGKSCLINTSGHRAFKKRYIVAFTAMNGLSGNRVTTKTPLPSTMRVDWVRVWR